ncbi:MAG: DASS family sodium-coupled anion symporter [Gammaproteobacteria bacterium]|nr:DASS family sodium-coupled anion symporter [Gammaproteobacteria bacterium]NNJ71949.1 DASS family sodium-coupled anion symporter [Enterobacterales bacterium]
MLVGAYLLTLSTPEGLTPFGHRVLVMSIVATILFVTEPIPLPAVALLMMVGQVFLLDTNSNDMAKSIMSDSVLFIMGSLMLAVAIVKQKLDKRIAFFIVKMTGTKTANICFGISVVSGLIASVVGEHTVAAMMLPVAITLIKLTSEDAKQVRSLAAVLLFSIAYGCSVAGISTPSGGARNAIMIGFWQEFFYDKNDPTTYKYLVDYVSWVMYCFPVFIAQLMLTSVIIQKTFKPEYHTLNRSVVKLRQQLAEQGNMDLSDYTTIGIFFMTLIGWVFFSDTLGLGTIALLGSICFLVFGLVKWEDINTNVNWGVILLYGSAISLGIQMKDTGAAEWLASQIVDLLGHIGAEGGMSLWLTVSALTAGVTNTMSNGAAVAMLGPVTLKMAVVADESPLLMGYITAISSAFAYLTVVGTPACTIVYSSGYLKSSDFLKVGWKMMIMSMFMLMLFAYFYWPLLGL